MNVHESRCKNLRKLIQQEKIDGLLVTNFTNVSYLTGFSGDDSYLLVSGDSQLLLSDPRYTIQLQEECPGLNCFIRDPGESMADAVVKSVNAAKIERLGVESASLTLLQDRSFANGAPAVERVPTNNLVEQLRLVKDRTEIDDTRLACRQAERAFHAVRSLLTPEMTELEIAAELEYQARRFGAQALSFPAIVAVGARSALPHARPTERKIGTANFTLIDWGAHTGRYMSDLTRILVIGRISPKLRKIYNVVLKAQLAAINSIRPGVSCGAVDSIARTVIRKAGFGKAFGHGLGHGLGLEIHEGPRLSKNQKLVLRPGMIVTVEPGIYLPGWGGIRIEDDVLVTRNGHEVLSDLPKQLEDCISPL